MKLLGPIHDPTFTSVSYNQFDRMLLSFIKDERDLPFLYLTLRISLILIPLGLMLYMPFLTGWAWWVLAIGYQYVNNLKFKGPFGLMLHCTSHRPMYKPAFKFMNNYLPWVVGPFFGHTPETYYSHHIGMHHAENNLPDDESSTMNYQRDSVRGFLGYFTAFFFFGLSELVAYLFKRNRVKLAWKAVAGEVSFVLLCIGLGFVNLPATLAVFVVPLLLSRIVMMLGNWTQHSFIDAADPGNPYKNSITCINVKYNHKCWNDGYHIGHHQRPGLHWTEHPTFFLKTLDKYAQNQAIVFDGADYLKIFISLMTRRYDVLAKHVVNINGNTFADEAEVIAVLKARTQRIPAVTELVTPLPRRVGVAA